MKDPDRGDADEFEEDLEKLHGRRVPAIRRCDACGSEPHPITLHIVEGKPRWLCALCEGGADT